VSGAGPWIAGIAAALAAACVAELPDPGVCLIASDVDRDGHGDPSRVIDLCELPPAERAFVLSAARWVDAADADDCDDREPAIHPGHAEVCDGIDNDCDGAAELACPAGCVIHDERLVCREPRTWAAAREICEREGMQLAAIDYEGEDGGIAASLMTRTGEYRGWLGGSDVTDEGFWRWTDGRLFWQGAALGAAYPDMVAGWAAGEPTIDDCLMLMPDGPTYGWRAMACTATAPFVCERS
jgi:hypothetical protein